MAEATRPVAVEAGAVEPMRPAGGYPEPYRSRAAGRVRRVLGDLFGLTNFGVNLTRLPPGGISALRHTHSREDEFVFILEGEPTLVTDAGETPLRPGMCAGFKAGSGDGHHLLNRTMHDVVYLEIGTRSKHERAGYPDVDLVMIRDDTGARYTHKNGEPYK